MNIQSYHIPASLPCLLQGADISSRVGPPGTDGQNAGRGSVHSVSKETRMFVMPLGNVSWDHPYYKMEGLDIQNTHIVI